MKKYRKTIFLTCIWLCFCIITGWVSANAIAKPMLLTDEEITYYTSAAKQAWYDGLDGIQKDDTFTINIQLLDNKVKISPTNTQKQSITVDFSNSNYVVTVNKPVVDYLGCFFFYGLFFGSIFYLLIFLWLLGFKYAIQKKL